MSSVLYIPPPNDDPPFLRPVTVRRPDGDIGPLCKACPLGSPPPYTTPSRSAPGSRTSSPAESPTDEKRDLFESPSSSTTTLSPPSPSLLSSPPTYNASDALAPLTRLNDFTSPNSYGPPLHLLEYPHNPARIRALPSTPITLPRGLQIPSLAKRITHDFPYPLPLTPYKVSPAHWAWFARDLMRLGHRSTRQQQINTVVATFVFLGVGAGLTPVLWPVIALGTSATLVVACVGAALTIGGVAAVGTSISLASLGRRVALWRAERHGRIAAVLAEWNDSFFHPKGLRVRFERPGKGVDELVSMDVLTRGWKRYHDAHEAADDLARDLERGHLAASLVPQTAAPTTTASSSSSTPRVPAHSNETSSRADARAQKKLEKAHLKARQKTHKAEVRAGRKARKEEDTAAQRGRIIVEPLGKAEPVKGKLPERVEEERKRLKAALERGGYVFGCAQGQGGGGVVGPGGGGGGGGEGRKGGKGD
ncbi:MAG: hypothetical protein M1819_001692 [Sarea resinae]|nr:MAG: hypothetical protein M1819_001692 [Sarea resinae]